MQINISGEAPSLEQVVARARKCGDVDVVLYESATTFQVCVGDPMRPRAQRLKRFSVARRPSAGAWLHRTILQLYPRSGYAFEHGADVEGSRGAVSGHATPRGWCCL